MKLFYIPSKKNAAKELSKISDLSLGKGEVKRFFNGDLYVQLDQEVKGDKCFVLGGVENDQLLETAFLSHTLKKEGAKEIIALIPYLAYARQDKNKKGESLGVKVVGEILKASGVKKTISIDIHSDKCKKIFPMPLISIDPLRFFAQRLNSIKLGEFFLVAPDQGALDNVKSLQKALNKKTSCPIFCIEKIRKGENIKITKSGGIVSGEAILVDDILSSGNTLIKAVKKIREKGVKKMIVIVSHAVFAGEGWKKLWDLGVERIYCLDSTSKKIKDKRIVYIKSSLIFSEYFK